METNKHFILGVFSDDEDVIGAAKNIRAAGVKIHEVFSPYPIHGIDDALANDRLVQADSPLSLRVTINRIVFDRRVHRHGGYHGLPCALANSSPARPFLRESQRGTVQYSIQRPLLEAPAKVSQDLHAKWQQEVPPPAVIHF